MRNILALAILGAAIVPTAGQAQSPYTYAWCALNADYTGATSCYYTTRAQCEASFSGGGGVCIQNPFRADSAGDSGRRR
jgi:hypothetical protein